jgi:hypothetical protein
MSVSLSNLRSVAGFVLNSDALGLSALCLTVPTSLRRWMGLTTDSLATKKLFWFVLLRLKNEEVLFSTGV